MDKTYASSPFMTVGSTVKEMFSSETTLIQQEKTVKTGQPPYPEYKPINPDSSKFYESKTIKAEKLVFKLR